MSLTDSLFLNKEAAESVLNRYMSECKDKRVWEAWQYLSNTDDWKMIELIQEYDDWKMELPSSIKEFINKKLGNSDTVSGDVPSDYDIDCLGMFIVNHTNEINNVDVKQRQKTNDENFDYAKNIIKEFISKDKREDSISHDAALGDGWQDSKKKLPENSNMVLGAWIELCGDVKLWNYAVVKYNKYGQGEWMKDTEVVDVIFWQEIDPPAFV